MSVTFADTLGYIAAFLVFLTFSMKTMVPLRIVGICSNVFFIAYGYLAPAYPLFFLHIALLPLNLFRLREMLMLVRQVGDATAGDLNMDWLKPFTTRQTVKGGEVLFRKGDKADAMYFVVSGEFKVTELGIPIGAGQVLGELGLLAPDQIRTQTIECVKEADLLRITYDQVRQLYFQNPKFGFYFLQLTSRRLFENIARLEKRLAEKGA
ncbi:MAG TPA: cyclic nucleotide-binding domain-containing protein [Pseudorhodoplanes sp.]|nr:cyclic nucleotide-binding domain-containing protein [Pseudorhodoplanes sp.]